MSKITIGQYYPTESIIHKLDPRTKLIGVVLYVVMLFFANNITSYLLAAFFLLTIIKIAKVPIKLLLQGLRAILFILFFAVVLNLFMTPGETVLIALGFLFVTMEGVIVAAQMGSRLILIIMGSSLLTLTTSPISLTDGIESLLKPLKKIRVPAHDIAMIMTIALRFIPTLAEEMEKIMKAQKARGADFDTGSLMQKIKCLLPILVPLFISAFKRADELATAMEARCYRGDVNRTKMKCLSYKKRDFVAILMLFSFSFIQIALRFFITEIF